MECYSWLIFGKFDASENMVLRKIPKSRCLYLWSIFGTVVLVLWSCLGRYIFCFLLSQCSASSVAETSCMGETESHQKRRQSHCCQTRCNNQYECRAVWSRTRLTCLQVIEPLSLFLTCFSSLPFPVIYVYNQCLLCFSFLPDMWYEATLFLQRASESGVSVWERESMWGVN